jgi:RNA polymerase sigma-70 factor (ECF subfamily)
MARSGRETTTLGRSVESPRAFDDFYGAHATAMLRFFARRTFDVEASRDLTAETFAEAFVHRARFRGDTDAEAGAWLYAIAHHRLARYVRKGVVERRAMKRLGIATPPIGEDDYERVIELAGWEELRAGLVDALQQLSPDQAEAIRLRVVDERSYADVAEIAGVSEATARARVSRGLRALTALLDTPNVRQATP